MSKTPAFTVTDLDREDGVITIQIKKGILGPLSNQLKVTSDRRKAASIIRKLGFVLGEGGDYLYDESLPEPDFIQK